jgi:Fe-S-cluster containining protein
MSKQPDACKLCRGACCEGLMFPSSEDEDVQRWFVYHGRDLGGGLIHIPSPCKHLQTCGTCAIHKHRPNVCRTYKVGGLSCRHTVSVQRPKDRDAIIALLDQP